MGDTEKTQEQLLSELAQLRSRIAELEEVVSEKKQAGEAFRESEEKYRNLVERASDGIIIVQDAVVKFANIRLAEMFGYTVNEIIDTPFLDLVSPDDRPKIMEIYKRRIQGKDVQDTYELQGLRKDGETVFLENHAGITTYNGKPATLAFLRDVSERMRTEQALRESEDKIRAIVETSKDWIWELNLQGIHTFSNPAVEAILGYRPEDLIGNLSLELLHEDDRVLVETKLPEWIEKKCGWQNIQLRWKHKEGGWRYLESNAEPILDADGSLLGFRGVDRDVTDRKQADEALRESEEKYRLLAENAMDVIWTMDLNLRFTYISPSITEMRGYTVDEAMAHPLEKVMLPESLEQAMANLGERLRLIEAGDEEGWKPTSFEAKQYCKDGTTIITNNNTRIMKGPDGRPSLIVGITHDITDRKLAEKALRESEEKYRTFFENSSDMMMVLNGEKCTDCNTAAVAMLGYESKEDLLGATPWRISPKHQPDGRESKEKAREMMETAYKLGAHRFEWNHQRKDGSLLPVDVSITATPSEGENVLIAVWRDISDRRKAEEELRESEEKYRLLAENVTDVVWVLDVDDDKFLYVTPSVENVLGFTSEEVCAKGLTLTLTPSSKANLESVVPGRIDRFKNGASEIFIDEFEQNHKSGHTIWTEVRARYVLNKKNGHIEAIGVSQDITERKRAEEELVKLATIVKHSSELVNLANLDGKMIFLNEAGGKMLGIDPGDVQQVQVMETIPDHWKELVQSELLPEIMKGGTWEGELQYHNLKTGKLIDVHAMTFAVNDPATGEPQFIANVSLDITEAKQAEQALNNSKEYLANIINAIGDPVFVKDEQFRFVLVNEALCKFLGKARDELVGTTGMEFLPADQMERFLEVDREVLSSGEENLSEEPLTGHDGNIQTIITKKTRYVDGQGAAFVVGVIRDVSERKKAEEERKKLEDQLRQSQKMESVGRLAGGVAHDFNNQLTAIIGFSELIKSSLDSNDPLFGEVEEVLKAADSASRLTAQLLAFSRKQTIDPKVVDINETVERSQKMLKRLIEEDIDLVFVPGKDLWRTKVDPGQLDQVMVNLSVNARDAMPDGGRLKIETANVAFDEEFCKIHAAAKPGDFVMLAVSDDGCGMEKEVLDNIFEPFFTTKAMDEGTGLGLSTVYGIVKQHGGFIYAYSEPGQGTSFKIYLPRVGEKVDEIAKPATDAPVFGSETVLLVEDNEMVRHLAKRILEKSGYRVLEAEQGGDAYLQCKAYEKEIHLLLTDVVMPKMSGKELYDQIAPLRPDIKVLYMSGYTDDAIVHRGVLDEGTPFIQKPFKVDALLHKVREVLDN
jgi:PAS domain S-box-containing protein